MVIGIYGVSGCGKSFLSRALREKLGEGQFRFYEGSEVIASLLPGGLEEFQEASPQEKERLRQAAIEHIRSDSASTGRAAVVAGHFMFWREEDGAGNVVCTQADLDTYTHILYLDPTPELIAERRRNDKRDRPSTSVDHLRRWQQAEKTELRRLCRDNGILFASLSDPATMLDRAAAMLLDFRQHTEELNLTRAMDSLDALLAARRSEESLQTALVFDADRTLASQDTGALFWEAVSKRVAQRAAYATENLNNDPIKMHNDPLKVLFGGPLGYSYTAFKQATLLYEEVTDDVDFDAICHEVASSVSLYPEMVSLLRHAGKHRHIVAVVVTCGLRRVWEMVLAREGLSDRVRVVGGGRIADGYVVTAEVKRASIASLRDGHGLYTWAFGDSVLDLPMLQAAHQAVVVVGEGHTRNKTMDEALLDAIDNKGLRARQALLPSHALPRLDTERLPLLSLSDPEFLGSLVHQRGAQARIFHAASRGAGKLLAAATRDARVCGPPLREAHRRVGSYLATELLTDVVGIEQYEIPHVQGHSVKGHRVRHEERTTIVALMRGGEPMAFGVNDVLPLAMFVHARQPGDLGPEHVKGQRTVVLVDSVVNSGTTVVEFVRRIRSFAATICIIVLVGVVQAGSLSSGGALRKILEHDENVSLVALRLSENKFTGTGTTDTGNRLFNTTRLP